LAADEIISDSDLETFKDNIEHLKEGDYNERERINSYFRNINAATRGGDIYEGSGASPHATNVEKAMLDHFDYRPVFVGGFTNHREPDVPDAGDGDGFPVDSQVAYVDGDWFHVGETNVGAKHINDIDEIIMAKDWSPASYNAVSVLEEFEEGNTDIENPERADLYVKNAVKSPASLNDNIGGEINLSDDISWNILHSIRENEAWAETMAPVELAIAIGESNQEFDTVDLEGEGLENPRFRIQ